jgi:hypothetical protein
MLFTTFVEILIIQHASRQALKHHFIITMLAGGNLSLLVCVVSNVFDLYREIKA